MKFLYRPLSLILFTLLLVSSLGLAASTNAKRISSSAIDCAGDCAERRDKMIERCDKLSGAAAGRCREMANKQYDKCLERCGD